MTARTCRIPITIELRGLPDDDRLTALTDTLARVVAERVAEADRKIAVRESWPSWQRAYAAPTIAFADDDVDDGLHHRLVQAIEAGIARALTGAPPVKPALQPASYRLPARAAAPNTPKTASERWEVKAEGRFHITPRHFFDIRRKLPGRGPKLDQIDLAELYYDILDERRPAVAWIVEVHQDYEFFALLDEVSQAFAGSLSVQETAFGLGGYSAVRQALVDADDDKVLAKRLPEFSDRGFVEVRADANGTKQAFLKPGGWLVASFLPLPTVKLDAFVEFGEASDVELKLSEIGDLIAEADFTAELGMQLEQIRSGAPDAKVTLWIEPFVVRRKINQHSLAALMGQRRRDLFDVRRLGRLLPLDDATLADLAPAVQLAIAAAPELPAKPAGKAGHKPAGIVHGTWQPGARGVNVTALFPHDLAEQAEIGLNAAFLNGEINEVIRILGLENGLMSNERNKALEAFVDRWGGRSGLLFGAFLSRLVQAGKLDAFFRLLAQLWDGDVLRWEVIIELASQTRFASHPAVIELMNRRNAVSLSTENYHYDFDAQEIWIRGDPNRRIHAAGTSTDDKMGVVGEVDDFYSDSSRIYLPKPEILDLLKEPTRKKVGEYMARTICGPGETMTREQLMQKAMQEAAQELSPPLTEADFVKVTMRRSVKVLKLESKVIAGVTQRYVHYQNVRKIGSLPWEADGEVQIRPTAAFEARLYFYVVDHEIRALTLFMLAETVLFGGLLIIELGVATIGQLIFFVGLQVAIYRFTTDAEDRTIEGYLAAALQGEFDAVGFKLISGFVKGAGQLVAARLISSELIGEVGTKWVLFTLRGVLTATGVGGLEVMNQFAQDLLRFSHCEGWSAPSVYWNRFKTGFVMALVLEFAVVPILTPPLRLALEKASTVTEAAVALRRSGKTLTEVLEALLKGTEEADSALSRTISRAEARVPMLDALRKRVAEMAKALGREYESRAYRSLLELYQTELGPEAMRGLRRLLAKTSEAEIDRALQKLLQQRGSASALFQAAGSMDEALLADLVKSGQLGQLGISRRLLALLGREPLAGSRILAGPFEAKVAEFEAYLGRLEKLPPSARESVVRALQQADPLAPELLFRAAQELGALDEPTLALLRRLRDAQIRIDALFDKSGPSLPEFARQFGAFSEAEQAAALKLAGGGTPADVLERAGRVRAEAEAAAKPPEAAPPKASEVPEAPGSGEPLPEGMPSGPRPDGTPAETPAEGEGGEAESPDEAPARRRGRRGPPPVLDQGERARVQAAIAQLQNDVADYAASARRNQEQLDALRARLKELAARPVPRAPLPRLPGIENPEARLEAIQELIARGGLSPEAMAYLNFLEETTRIAAEIEDLVGANTKLGEMLDRASQVDDPRLQGLLSRAGKALSELLRRVGPNYRRLSNVGFDQIVGEQRWLDRWPAGSTRPLLANDHLVALDRIARRPELTELLGIYAQAPEGIKTQIVDDLVAIGDDSENLVRMRRDANLMKGNRSWENITYGEANEFDYGATDVERMRGKEGRSLARILKAIAEATTRYR
ncbi:MAG: hypothetical protein P4M09_03075 [Devosia sp.]|nr:hypothetical protein [Devosia sp.]